MVDVWDDDGRDIPQPSDDVSRLIEVPHMGGTFIMPSNAHPCRLLPRAWPTARSRRKGASDHAAHLAAAGARPTKAWSVALLSAFRLLPLDTRWPAMSNRDCLTWISHFAGSDHRLGRRLWRCSETVCCRGSCGPGHCRHRSASQRVCLTTTSLRQRCSSIPLSVRVAARTALNLSETSGATSSVSIYARDNHRRQTCGSLRERSQAALVELVGGG